MGVTKGFIEKNKGVIPVYGGKIYEDPIGYIADNLKNVKYFENCLAWNREGSVGYVFWHKHKFTTNDHHRPLKVKDKYLGQFDLGYLRYILQEILLNQGFKWSQTASKDKVGKISIPIPILPNGDIDLARQQEIVEKHNLVEELKDKAKVYERTLKDLSIKFDNQLDLSKEVLINEIFNLPSIKGVTKHFIERNRGNIPAYGGKMFEEPMGYVEDNLAGVKYFENCLAWNRNGTTGYVFFHNHKFTTTDDHRPLILKDAYKDSIDLEYARIIIEGILVSRYSWGDKAGKDKVEKISFRVPILPNGEFDISAQKEISSMNSKVDEIKQSLIAELRKITDLTLK